MSTESAESGHGNSPAAWTAVVIMLVAFSVGTIAFWFSIEPLVWISAAVVLLGWITGGVMKKLGFGVDGHRTARSKAHS
jgi:predicted Kef-type K+ transport protein